MHLAGYWKGPFGKGCFQAFAINRAFDELISGTLAFSVFAGCLIGACVVCVAACLELAHVLRGLRDCMELQFVWSDCMVAVRVA